MFRVKARALLELGSELISSDIIAFYELIKNGFDAGSKTGVDIRFEVVLSRRAYRWLGRAIRAKATKPSPRRAADLVRAELLTDAGQLYDDACELLEAPNSVDDVASALDQIYGLNRVTISDTGIGMSEAELTSLFLVIGTPSRKKHIDQALAKGSTTAPFLGEKGIGRLSAMRLGDYLEVRTTQTGDSLWHRLNIDWTEFADLDALVDEIRVEPFPGAEKRKRKRKRSGTDIRISQLTSDWTRQHLEQLARDDFSLMFASRPSTRKRRRVALHWNGDRVAIPKLDDRLLQHCHASVTGSYIVDDTRVKLQTEIQIKHLGFEHPPENRFLELDHDDLSTALIGKDSGLDLTALETVGPFVFEAYWFNRQRLRAIDGVGDHALVRKLHNQWTGIRLYRDGLRVFPYGSEQDDWLGLDRRALRARGYTLNKAQFIGQVDIGRMSNPELIDQTNREGLRETPEQQILLEVLRLVVQDQLRFEMHHAEEQYKEKRVDMTNSKTEVRELLQRSRTSARALRKLSLPTEDHQTVDDLQQLIHDFSDFATRAQARIDEAETDARRMTDMAGVGLLVEVVAHELARTSENALDNLNVLHRAAPAQIRGQLDVLRSSMKTISKRLRVLDPLSVSGRQAAETFNLQDVLNDTIDAHRPQFRRHGVEPDLRMPSRAVRVRAVKGMILQVIENLISNSVYWLDLERDRHRRFQPAISIELDETSTITYEDNGPGITPVYADRVFELFFSLKEKTRRRGMGLYIARECAEFNGGSLVLDPATNERGKLFRFVYAVTEAGHR